MNIHLIPCDGDNCDQVQAKGMVLTKDYNNCPKEIYHGKDTIHCVWFLWFVCTQLNLFLTFKLTWKVSKEKKFNVALQFHAKNYTIWSFWFLKNNVQFLLYFEETQNATANVNFLISTRRLTSITKNNKVQDLHYILHFVKVKQHTHYQCKSLPITYF